MPQPHVWSAGHPASASAPVSPHFLLQMHLLQLVKFSRRAQLGIVNKRVSPKSTFVPVPRLEGNHLAEERRWTQLRCEIPPWFKVTPGNLYVSLKMTMEILLSPNYLKNLKIIYLQFLNIVTSFLLVMIITIMFIVYKYSICSQVIPAHGIQPYSEGYTWADSEFHLQISWLLPQKHLP